MLEFLTFKKMVTPVIIQVIFWILVAVVIIGGLVSLFNGNIIPGLVGIFLGPIIVRIYCELMIIAFRIEANTRK